MRFSTAAFAASLLVGASANPSALQARALNEASRALNELSRAFNEASYAESQVSPNVVRSMSAPSYGVSAVDSYANTASLQPREAVADKAGGGWGGSGGWGGAPPAFPVPVSAPAAAPAPAPAPQTVVVQPGQPGYQAQGQVIGQNGQVYWNSAQSLTSGSSFLVVVGGTLSAFMFCLL